MCYNMNSLQCTIFVLVCCSIPEIMAISYLSKDFAIAAILGGILKPRFVPVPIPIPFHFKIKKHIVKPYPVHKYGHSSYGNQWSNGMNDYSNFDSLTSGTHALANLHSASENIDSFVKQLSLSSTDIMKNSETLTMPNVHNGLEEYEAMDEFTNFRDWWRK